MSKTRSAEAPDMANLRAALEAIAQADGEYRTATPEGWTQGRTLYGGMTAAMSAHVASQFAAPLPPLRCAQFSFVGPAAGALVFRPLLLRQGRTATGIGVDCFSDGQLAARGVLTYGAARPSVVRHERRLETPAPAPEQCAPFLDPARSGAGFFQNFDLRLARGSRLASGTAAPPAFDVWIRHRDADGVDPAVALLALADGLPPAAMAQFPSRAPISTMTWAIDIVQPLTQHAWLLARSVSEACADGYSQQAMALFDPEGARVAAGRQTIAIFV